MKVLLVEDNQDHAELIEDALASSYASRLTLKHVGKLSDGLELLNNEEWSIFLCDLNLPDSDIQHTVETLQNLQSPSAIVVLTSLDDEDTASLLLGKGIQDYYPKDKIDSDMLARVCQHSIERKKLLRSLEEKNRDQQQFCYSLCHDFKEPIRKIATIVSMLKSDIQGKITLSEENQWSFDAVEKNVENLLAITDGLYEYLSLSQHSFENVDLNDVLKKCLNHFTKGKEFQLQQDELPHLQGNASQLQLLFKNLIENSIKYSKGPANITIAYKLDTLQGLHKIQVSDQGIGISPEDVDKVLLPFKRSVSKQEYPGIGLGLSIVKRILENHSATLNIESTKAKGTVVTLSFPQSPKTGAAN